MVGPSAAARSEAALLALDRATRAIAGELDLDRVLQLIVDSVRELVGARYAALGTFDERGRIERFITSGMDAALRRQIGPLPPARCVRHGRGGREGKRPELPRMPATRSRFAMATSFWAYQQRPSPGRWRASRRRLGCFVVTRISRATIVQTWRGAMYDWRPSHARSVVTRIWRPTIVLAASARCAD